MALKFAKQSAVLDLDGARIILNVGDVWDDSDPVVKRYPDQFDDRPKKVRTSIPPEAPVEDASAEPGKKRTTRKRTAPKD